MSQIFVPRKYDVLEKRTFKNTAAALMGRMVEIDSSKEIAVTSDFEKAIGIIDNMPTERAENDSGTLPAGEMAQIALFGITFNGVSSGTFNIGEYVKPSSGKIVVSATATTMIALTASTASDQAIEYMVK